VANKSFTGGKKTLAATANEPFAAGDADPHSIAKMVLEHRASSVREDVKSHVALSEGVHVLLDNDEALDELLAILIDRKVLAKDEADIKLSASESHLSMLNKINRYRAVILDERVLAYLPPGYSTLYQVVSLYEDLGDENGSN
jgi:hypothetical protein